MKAPLRVSHVGVVALFIAACGSQPKTAQNPASDFAPTGAPDAAAQSLCPLAPVTVGEQRLRVTLSGDVLFDFDKDNLKPDAVSVLTKVKTTVVAEHPDAKMTVEGYTDGIGPADYNIGLSQRRAASVGAWFEQNGFPTAQVTEKGYGKDFPVAPNDTPEHRALNRRVELVLVWGGGGATAAAPACPGVQACCDLATMSGRTGLEPGCIGRDVSATGWDSNLESDDLDDAQGVLRLDPCVATRAAAVWITSTNEMKISRLDERTGKELFRVPTFGHFPQRTAVAQDGSVWVTNRDSYAYVHIGGDGKLICSSPYKTCYTRAAAVDGKGFGWIGCNDTGDVIQASPTETDGTTEVEDPDGNKLTVPMCKEVGRLTTTTNPYGLVVDHEGGMWTAVSGGGTIAKIDTATRKVLMTVDPSKDPMMAKDGCWSPYGIAIDRDGNPWYANYGCKTVVKIDGTNGHILGIFKGGPDGLNQPRALGLDREGHAWVSENGATFVDELDADGTFMRKVDTTSCGGTSGPLGTAADSEGNMWTAIQDAGKVMKYSTDGKIIGCYPADPTPAYQNAYTYSDFTGAGMEIAGSNDGVARVRVDNGASAVQWRLASFTALVPDNTNLCVRARSAASTAGLDAAAWSAVTCPKQPTRGIVDVALDGARGGATKVPPGGAVELEFSLSSSAPGSSPLVSGLSVAATPPGAP
jgi:outer membrane protein OmpA-like peptidoglycan-associated protein/streptogramin lyase